MTAAVGRSSSGAPRVTLTVASSPTVNAVLTIYRTHADGSRHKVLTNGVASLLGSFAGFDYHAPFNQRLTYTAEAAGQVSAAVGVGPISSRRVWLIHPTLTALSVSPEHIREVADYGYESRVTEYQVLGARLPDFRATHPRSGMSSTITVGCRTYAARARVDELLADGGPILLNAPGPARGDDLGWLWIQPLTTPVKNPTGKMRRQYRDVAIGFRECNQPDADASGERSLDELSAEFPTLNLLDARYASLDNITLDLRVP